MTGGSAATVDVLIETTTDPEFSYERIRDIADRVIQTIAAGEDSGRGEVSVAVVDEEAIRELNRHYRGNDAVTDVLSFSQREPGALDGLVFDEIGEEDVLGDIVVCWGKVRLQALQYGHSMEREFAFLIAHGFLHLLGYDHQTEEEEARMFSRQEQALSVLGITR